MLSSEFPQEQLDQLCNEILTTIEYSEWKLLNWGFVEPRSDLRTTLPTLLKGLSERGRTLWDEAQQFDITTDDVLHNLIERCLLFKDTLSEREVYRSRFAETIRLLSLLRQRFSYTDWQTASRLVSDLKIDLRRRSYPQRTITSHTMIQSLRQLGANALYTGAVECLLRDQQGSTLKLARFQQEAILQQYSILHPRQGMPLHSDRGLVIGAGTGSGKTKAFYIPAMAEIAATLTETPYVRALAIYPRIELLKDQFAEAFQEARKLDDFLIQHKPRIITIGAYYSDTLPTVKFLLDASKTGTIYGWRKGTHGWECPFFSCPNSQHPHQSLVWYYEDVKHENAENQQKRYGAYARLRCPDCYFQTQAHQLILTREQMTHNPPDLLFTTTEMLNRRLSRTEEHPLFGIDTGQVPSPRLLLLDEIHTYEGLTGTQVAYLLRRWRHARSRQRYVTLCCVGLSATLTNAEAFFARLTGIATSHVSYVHPKDQDMEEEGIEYNLVLKGDPVSGTSLLSTSIQTVMLLGRMLDKSETEPSRYAYGQKIFAFTDKLDVLNRWFHIEQDAETTKVLSKYRRSQPGDISEIRTKKQQAGQLWKACELIGHSLSSPLRLDLTSSQNRGVDARANLVIATSTLEVGFNDPTVGAVIQHKAPRSLASFLQRKGRAGRDRRMRPWMAVVTSAYGRDRWAFQHAESLFSPTLSDMHLPLDNYYVRKMQATFAFMDWLALKLKDETRSSSIDIWDLLRSDEKKRSDFLQQQRQVACKVIEEVLNGSLRDHLALYLQQSLGLSDQQVIHSIFWEEPRSLLFEVLPTILRQLESSWQRLKGNQVEVWADHTANYPLPDFVSPNLFADLQAPEVSLHLPSDIQERFDKQKQRIKTVTERPDEQLPLLQCLKEFAPGNINKRYARHNRLQEAHWLEISDDVSLQNGKLPLSLLSIEYDSVPQPLHIEGKSYYIYRPYAYTLKQVPKEVKQTSIAHIGWHSHFIPKQLHYDTQSEAIEPNASKEEQIILPQRSVWHTFFTRINSYTQLNGTVVEVARLATDVQVETRYQGKKPARRLWLEFTQNEQPAGLGFVHYVDALAFHIQPLAVDQLLQHIYWPTLYRSLGPTFFHYKLQHDPRIIAAKLSIFEIEWLWQLEFSMLVAAAVATGCSLEQAAQIVRSQRLSLADRTMKVIFQSQQLEDYDEEKISWLHEKLKTLLGDLQMQQALDACEPVLWHWQDEQLPGWLQQCHASSLGSTLFNALAELAPDIDPDELALDIQDNTIWISEMIPGGIGIISKIVDILTTRPYDFELQMFDTLHYCERQQLATQLQQVSYLSMQKDRALLDLFTTIRSDMDLPRQEHTLSLLKAVLEARGIPATRELVVALHARFLRPNSDSDTDALIATLVDFWQREEQRLGCAIDLRVIAVAALKKDEIKQQVESILVRINGTDKVEENQIFNLFQSLLWLPCTDSCLDCIERQYQFQDFVKPSRALLLTLLEPRTQYISYDEPNWQEQMQQQLSAHYTAHLRCSQEQLEECKQTVVTLLTTPVDIGFQLLYPVVEHITRTGLVWTLKLSIREFAHA